MKITICSSLSFNSEVMEIKKKLESFGHTVLIPETMLECEKNGVTDIKSWLAKQPKDYSHGKMRLHFNKVKESDAILVCNIDKNNIKNYIGPSSFLEMGIAFHNNKKIFLLNPIPEMNQTFEINLMRPTVIDGNLEEIK